MTGDGMAGWLRAYEAEEAEQLPFEARMQVWSPDSAATYLRSHPHADEYDDDEESLLTAVFPLVLFLLWMAFLATLGVGALHDRSTEERRVREIRALLREGSRLWSTMDSTEAAGGTGGGSSSVLMECCLCLEKFSEGDVVCKLPCGHLFRTECIEHWLMTTRYRARSCPICRQNPLLSSAEFDHVEHSVNEPQWDSHEQLQSGGTHYARPRPLISEELLWQTYQPCPSRCPACLLPHPWGVRRMMMM
jgi:hypothetical protein